jgi:hypothetical protein
MLFREEDEDLEVLPFADRAEAGRILAGKLSAYANGTDVIVLGLPRSARGLRGGGRAARPAGCCGNPVMPVF